MKNQFIRFLFFFAFCVPLLYSCSTTKEYYSIGPAAGKFHGTKTEKNTADANLPIAENKGEALSVEPAPGSATTPAELPLTASSDLAPDVNLATTEAKLQAATAEAAAMQNAQAGKINTGKTKLNLVQKLALKKMQKMLKKASESKKVENAQEKPGLLQKLMLDQNLKLALIFLVVSLIGYIFSWILGTILFIVALVFLILWISTL